MPVWLFSIYRFHWISPSTRHNGSQAGVPQIVALSPYQAVQCSALMQRCGWLVWMWETVRAVEVGGSFTASPSDSSQNRFSIRKDFRFKTDSVLSGGFRVSPCCCVATKCHESDCVDFIFVKGKANKSKSGRRFEHLSMLKMHVISKFYLLDKNHNFYARGFSFTPAEASPASDWRA